MVLTTRGAGFAYLTLHRTAQVGDPATVDRQQFASSAEGIPLRRLVVTNDSPSDDVTGSVPGLIEPLTEVTAVPPGMTGFDGEP